ncbi:MAG: hypothetical protein AABY87_12880 [bacterium]
MDTLFGLKKTAFLAMVWVLCLVAMGRSAGAEVFNTEVRVILASNSDQGYDPRLLDLKKDLLSLNYMSFQLIDQTGLSLNRGQSGKMPIPGGRTMELTPTGVEQGKIVMQVSINEGGSSLLKTQIRIANHGTVIIGGPPYQSGFIVLAITAHF